MRYSLRTLWRRQANPRRNEVVLRKVQVPSTFASDLYASAYRPVMAAWEGALPAIVAEYERSLAEIVTDSPTDTAAVIERVDATLAALLITIRARISEWSRRLELHHRRKWRGAVLTATKVDIGTLVGAGDMRMPLEAAIERNVALVRNVSEQARQRISDSVFRGFQRRAAPREVAKELRGAVEMGRRRALNIAADQTVKLASALNDERRREAGLTTWEWVHSGKLHPREEHVARNGKRYDDDARSGPHKPPEDRPGEKPFCGCTSRAVLTLDGEF